MQLVFQVTGFAVNQACTVSSRDKTGLDKIREGHSPEFFMPTRKKAISALCVVVAFVTACHSQKGTASSNAAPDVQKPPFSLSVVPETSHEEPFGGSIEMAHNKPREFFVVLTNVSQETQPVWEYWYSWGYQNVSFELSAADGRKFVVSKKQEDFTRNFPSTFLIGPGEHQVYSIRLNERWDTHPLLPKADEMP